MHNFVEKNKQAGLSLLEILISIVILSVGLLSIAQLQVTTIRINKNAALRSQAHLLADNFFEKLRALRFIPTARRITCQGTQQGVIQLTCRAASPCNTASFRTEDLNLWFRSICTNLPNATIAYEPSGNNAVTLTLGWTERNIEDGGEGSNQRNANQRQTLIITGQL